MVTMIDMDYHEEVKGEPALGISFQLDVPGSHENKETDSSASNNSGPNDSHQQKASPKRKKRKWKWPKGKPKRPLTAYNYFFQHEREILKTGASSNTEDIKLSSRQGKAGVPIGLGFLGLTKKVVAKWKTLEKSERKFFEDLAAMDKRRYFSEIAIWSKEKEKEGSQLGIQPHPDYSPDTLSEELCTTSQSMGQTFQLPNQNNQETQRYQLMNWSQNVPASYGNMQSTHTGPASSSNSMGVHDSTFLQWVSQAQNAPNYDEPVELNQPMNTTTFAPRQSFPSTTDTGTNERISNSLHGAENIVVDDAFIDFLHGFEQE